MCYFQAHHWDIEVGVEPVGATLSTKKSPCTDCTVKPRFVPPQSFPRHCFGPWLCPPSLLHTYATSNLYHYAFQVHSSPVVGIRESPNENTLITVGEDGSIFVFHLNKPSGIEAGGAGIITISVIELFTPPTFRHLSSSFVIYQPIIVTKKTPPPPPPPPRFFFFSSFFIR